LEHTNQREQTKHVTQSTEYIGIVAHLIRTWSFLHANKWF